MRYVSQQFIDQNDPRRLWNWRAQRASALVKSGVNTTTLEAYDDDFVLVFTDMLSRREKVTSEQAWKRIASRYKGAWDAWSFYRTQSVMTKHLLEAWILADCSDEEIAQLFAMTPAGVRWYEKMYCDVRSRLRNRMFITTYILHPPDSKVSSEEASLPKYRNSDNSLGMIYKLFGYYGGPVAVEFIYTGLLNTGKPRGNKETDTYVNKAISSFLRTRGLTAIKVGELNKFNLPQFVDMASRVAAEESAQADMNVLASVTEFVSLLNLNDNVSPNAALSDITAGTPEQIQRITNEMFSGAVEPTAAELSALGRGEISDSYLNALERHKADLIKI